MATLRTLVLGDPVRRRELAEIHIAKKQLAMEDDAYRDMLWSVARVRSSGDLDFAGRRAVLEHLRKCGFKPRRRQLARDPQSRKIRALWLELKGLGALRDASEEALGRFVMRETGAAALQWLSSDQASSVIEALKSWVKRARRSIPRGIDG